MSKRPGSFVWYDVMTTDTKSAGSFYSKVMGWTLQEAPPPNSMYTIFSVGPDKTGGVGGLMPIPDDAKKRGVPPHWSGYILVDDVDTYAQRVKAAGGAIYLEAQDIPNVGRFAVAVDPQGAKFILFKPLSTEERPSVDTKTPGHFDWHELHTTDLEGAFAFYAKLFGWVKDHALDMGPMGIYQTFTIDGKLCGGMMTKSAEAPMSFWLYYTFVDSIDAAIARVNDNGGKVISGPDQVPGDAWIATCSDPQGAMFAMVAPRK